MLRQRLPVGIALILLFIGLLYVDGLTAPYYPVWHALVLISGILGSIELALIFKHVGVEPLRIQMIVGVSLTLLLNAITPVMGYHGLSVLGPVGLGVMVSVIILLLSGVWLFGDERPVLPRIASTLLGIVYIGGCGSFLTQLRVLNGPVSGAFALGLVVGVTKGTDIGAYTFGKLFGRHLMTPRLSPKKTWEGAFGGVLFAMLLAWIVSIIELQVRGAYTLESLPVRFVFALVVSVFGQLGDLAESMMKREANQKDASAVIPGFGGVLDLLDSLFLAAPVGWAILTVLS